MADASTAHPAPPPPTSSARISFALLLPVFFALLGLMLVRRPHGLVMAAGFCSVATLATMLIDRKHAKAHAIGFVIPLVLLTMVGITRAGVAPRAVAYALFAFGVVLGICALLSAKAGNGIYVFWMRLGEPIGYSVSLLVLSISFYVVFTPLGLLMRALGKDPMNRAFDKSASSYWIEHDPSGEPSRYFRQF